MQEGQQEGHRGKRKTTILNQKMCCSDKKWEEIKTEKKSKTVWGKSDGQSLKLLLRFERELCSNERKDVVVWNSNEIWRKFYHLFFLIRN